MGKKTRLKFLERNGAKFVSFSIGFGKYSRRGKPLDSTYFLHPFRTRKKNCLEKLMLFLAPVRGRAL